MARDSCRKSDTDSYVANRWTAVTSHLSFNSNHTKDDGKPQTRLGVAKPRSYDGLETVTVQHNWGDTGWHTHRMVDSPHNHAEQRVAGTEQLHFLGDEVFLLGLGFARNWCGNAARRSHLSVNWPVAAVGVKILAAVFPPLEAGSVATDSRLSNTKAIHLASSQNQVSQFSSSFNVPHQIGWRYAIT